jgi:hypothetical protein
MAPHVAHRSDAVRNVRAQVCLDDMDVHVRERRHEHASIAVNDDCASRACRFGVRTTHPLDHAIAHVNRLTLE